MLSRKTRLPHHVFTGRPDRRVRFEFGTVALYSHNLAKSGGAGVVVVSKKVAKSAPLRNRIRRRAYAALRALMPFSHAIAVYPTKEMATAPFQKIIESLRGALH
ncbi:MAG: ribonuclease P protein component [Patescibacteria group bacterium]